MSEWKHEASGGVVVGLHAARGGVLCGPISSPTVWALPFILQGTGRLRQGAKGSHHSREGGRKRGSRLSQGRPPPSGPWVTGQGCAGGRGREDREERERGQENPDMGARPAMAGGERARAWRAVVLGAGPSGQNPVPPIAAGSRLRHGGKRRHRILSHPLLKAAFRKHRHPSDRRSGRLA